MFSYVILIVWEGAWSAYQQLWIILVISVPPYFKTIQWLLIKCHFCKLKQCTIVYVKDQQEMYVIDKKKDQPEMYYWNVIMSS